jgi:hypothetical protein
MLLDTRLNGRYAVGKTIFQNAIETAMKLHRYLKTLQSAWAVDADHIIGQSFLLYSLVNSRIYPSYSSLIVFSNLLLAPYLCLNTLFPLLSIDTDPWTHCFTSINDMLRIAA